MLNIKISTHDYYYYYYISVHKLRCKQLSITPKILLIKDFNHETEKKATHVGSTALMLMFLPNRENIKTQLRLLTVPFNILHVYQVYKCYQ